MLLFLEVAIHTVLENRPRGSYNSKIVRVNTINLGKSFKNNHERIQFW